MSRTVTEWIGRNDNAPIPDRVKERVAYKSGDCCKKCDRKIEGKLRAEFDHAIPLILGGKHAESNLQLLCHECHSAKTKLDVKLKAKVARVRKRHLGIKKPRTIRTWRRFDGTPVYAGRDR
jgi:5-methylcytosine-specific restriction endonuclease McrA